MSFLAAVGPGAALGICHNEETFCDFLPVASLAATGDLFISKSGHGMGCHELVTWLLHRRAWLNPFLSATEFTHEDIAAIRAWDRPEIKRLSELDDAAAAHVLLAQDARSLGNVQAESEHLRQAAVLSPDRAHTFFDTWTAPPSMPTRRASAAPSAVDLGALVAPAQRGWRGRFGRRTSAPPAAMPMALPAAHRRAL